MMLRAAALACLALLTLPAFAADDDPAERPVPPTGKLTKGHTMDYGPAFASSLASRNLKQPSRPLASRALTIRLADKTAIAYDTETMRVVIAWAGWLDLNKTHMTGPKGSIPPAVDGPSLFETPNAPGWSNAGSLADPRTDPHAPKGGPLPRDWARFGGLYLHGDRAVLSYTVGQSNVLESPEHVALGAGGAFARTIRIDRSAEPLTLVLAYAQDNLHVALAAAPAGAKLETVDNVLRLALPALAEPATFTVFLSSADPAGIAQAYKPADLVALTKGGPARWAKPVETAGVLGPAPAKGAALPYVVDTLTLPFDNPYDAWFRPTALDFFADGKTAALATWNGDVWVVSGIDASLAHLSWRRFATGLYEPLGLKVYKETVYVLGRDQVTRLHDLNADGEADFYENFNNDGICYPQYHHFKMDLDADLLGNLYYTAGGNWATNESLATYNSIIKVSANGAKSTVIARGLRAANGMAVGPRGEIVAGDNQGHWTPSSKINYIPPGRFGGFYGYPFDPRVAKLVDVPHFYPAGMPAAFEPPLCWIPYALDNSSGGQAFVPADDDRWGPFAGHVVHTSYGKSTLFMVCHELVPGPDNKPVAQGGVWKFPLTFEAGVMRPRFNPGDGQLYVAGMRGWQTNSAKDGCLQRVRYAGGPVRAPEAVRATKQGVYLTFTAKLDPATANDPGSFDVEQWNYKWTSAYGSPEFSVENPSKKGHDTVDVKSAKLQPDGYTVFLEMPTIRPVMQMSITYKLKSPDGHPIDGAFYNTINALK